MRVRASDSVQVGRMNRLMLHGTAEPVSQDQILRRERGQGFFGGNYCTMMDDGCSGHFVVVRYNRDRSIFVFHKERRS